jgi:phosphoribosyl 1,2-cyclic phosphodiesterase
VKIRFWGVRGSIPSPGPGTVRYGGNTTCIELETDDGRTIIFDAGTGIYPLAQSLLGRMPLACTIFITHTHWDHIQGLPFFVPLFVPGNSVQIFGGFNPVLQRGIGEVLSRQMEYSYFPVREAELKAVMEYGSLGEGQSVEIGATRVTAVLMNHTVLNFGYRIDCGDRSLFFTGDHEPPYNIYGPGDETYAEYGKLIDQKNDAILSAIRGVDILIADGSYTALEYPAKMGWGHGTGESCVAMALQAGVKALWLTHHEPLRSDDELDRIGARLRQDPVVQESSLRLGIAQEGIELTL